MLNDLSLKALIQRYNDNEEQAWLDLESLVWAHGPVCPHCGVIDRAYYLKPQNGPRLTRAGKPTFRRIYKCKDCLKKFSVLKGTIFEDTKLPISTWLCAIKLYTSAKNGISGHEVHRQLGVSYETAWFLEHRLRYAVAATTPQRPLSGTVEVDETYIGGRAPTSRHLDNKTPVLTLVERDGEARSHVMPTVTAKNARQVLWSSVHEDSELMTDESQLYPVSGRVFAVHGTVNHAQGEYVRGRFHINTAEGFFSQLKRSLDGTFHHVSATHLHRYVAEFDFRYNTRKEKDFDRFKIVVGKAHGKRLMYSHAIKANVGE